MVEQLFTVLIMPTNPPYPHDAIDFGILRLAWSIKTQAATIG